MKALLRDGGQVASGLADREEALQLLARSGDRAFNATGRQGRGARRRLPRAARVRARRPAHGRAADGAGRGAHGRRDGAARQARSLQPRARGAVGGRADLHAIVAATPALGRKGRRGLPPSTGSSTRRRPSSSTSTRSCGASTPLRHISAGRGELTTLVANLAAATQTATATPRAASRCTTCARCRCSSRRAGPAVERPGASRANAYPDPSQLDLLAGYLLETGHCGRPTPYISGDPTPLLTDLQREQIRLYAFGGGPANPPRPACKQQAGGVPRLVADPAGG